MKRAVDECKIKDVDPKSAYGRKGYLWLVETRIGRKRSRKFFRHGEAEERDQYYKEQDALCTDMAKEERKQTLDNDLQRQLNEAVKILLPWKATLVEAAKFYAQHLKEKDNEDSATIEQGISAHIEAMKKRKLNVKTINRARQTLRRFSDSFPDKTLASLTGRDVQLWWEQCGSIANQRANRIVVNTFLNWCVRSSAFEGFTGNPTPPPPEEENEGEKKLLFASEVQNLLEHASSELLPLIVAQVFFGVRVEESVRLRWEFFDWEEQEIALPAFMAKGKKKHARVNEIPDNAMQWLRPYMNKQKGPVLAKIKTRDGYNAAMKAIHEKAGWNDENPWPKNALRRTFISSHYATYDNVGKTAKIAGNTESVIRNSYLAAVTKTQAKKLWEVTPLMKNPKVIQLAS